MRELPEGAELKIAKIKSTMLGYEDHGIMTCYLDLDYGGVGQGAGGYGLDRPNPAVKYGPRVGTAYGMDFIMRVMRATGVERWEDIPGKTVYAVAGRNKVYAIIPLPTEGKEEDGFWFEDLIDEFEDDETGSTRKVASDE